jgi:hypothetical protein
MPQAEGGLVRGVIIARWAPPPLREEVVRPQRTRKGKESTPLLATLRI